MRAGSVEEGWRDRFVEAWSALEIGYAVALNRLQEIPTIRDPDVAEGVKELDALVSAQMQRPGVRAAVYVTYLI